MSADLYNEQIVAAARAADGAGNLADPDVVVERDNPLCGDRIRLELHLRQGRIAALAHRTRGCLLTRAAASLLARRARGLDVAAARALRARIERLLAGGETAEDPDLAMFRPVASVRSRHECVLLPFEALVHAFESAESGPEAS